MHRDDHRSRRAVLEQLQGGLPVCEQPYAEAARQLALSEAQLLALLEAMLDDGTIRRIGLVPNHYALGYSHNIMSVWDIEDGLIEPLGRAVAELPFVSHCYQRPRCWPDWPYNLFAMVHAKSEAEGRTMLERIEQRLGAACRGGCQLNSKRILKKTGLRIHREDR